MDISHTLAHHARVKHADVDQNFIKQKIDTGIVTDLLTKDLLMACFLQQISKPSCRISMHQLDRQHWTTYLPIGPYVSSFMCCTLFVLFLSYLSYIRYLNISFHELKRYSSYLVSSISIYGQSRVSWEWSLININVERGINTFRYVDGPLEWNKGIYKRKERNGNISK